MEGQGTHNPGTGYWILGDVSPVTGDEPLISACAVKAGCCAAQTKAPIPDLLDQLRAFSIRALAGYLPNVVSLLAVHHKGPRMCPSLYRRSSSRFPCSTIVRTSMDWPAPTQQVRSIPTSLSGIPISSQDQPQAALCSSLTGENSPSISLSHSGNR